MWAKTQQKNMYGSSSTVTVPRRREPIESRRSFRLGTSPRKPSSSVYEREYPRNDNDHRSQKTVAPPSAAEAQGDCSHPAWPTAQGDAVEDADTSHHVHERHFFSEEAFHPASYAHRPSQAHRPSPTSGACEEAAVHTAKSKQYHGRGWSGDARGAYCQGGNCSTPPSYSVDGRKPAVLCGNHREHGMFRVLHNNRNCGYKGCGRTAQVRYMSEDGRINRFCFKHKKVDVIVAKTRHCEYAGCGSVPSYGVKEGPQNFCREHKRAGMFTSRNGELVVATRDGNAYRAEGSSSGRSSAKQASACADGVPHSPARSATAAPPEAGSSPHPETRTSTDSPGKNILLNRRLCEVPGCLVQPSYGETGTGRPRFCAGHKKKGMVGLKNRPCHFPGCDTRPHYGLSGGRPQYCATHKSDGMIHLLKESLSRVRVRAPRKKEKKEESRPTVTATATEKNDLSAAAESTENEHKSSDPKETAGREHDNDNEQPEEKQEKETRVRAKRKRSRRKVAIAATGTAGAKEKVSSPEPPPALAPPSGGSSASSSSSSSSSSSPLPASSPPPVIKGVPPCAAAKKDAEVSPSAQTSPAAQQTSAEVKQCPPASRMAEAPGLSPSIEIRLLREARESAKALAAANGSGRRARAPSRKALEASGKMTSEGAQWMTREKKEEQARAKRELKEQRRAAAAAGLKTGHVIEACAVLAPGGAGGQGGGGGSDDRGVGGGGVVPSNPTWRKLSPAEILQTAARQPAAEGTSPKAHDKGANTEPEANAHDKEGATTEAKEKAHDKEGANTELKKNAHDKSANTELKGKTHDKGATTNEPKAGVSGSKQQGGGGVVSPVVEASKEPAAKKRKRKKVGPAAEDVPASDVDKGRGSKRGRKTKETAEDDSNDRVEQAPNKEVKKRIRRRGKEAADGGTKVGQAAGSATTCEFQSCSKAAMYGANGTVRFCKTHRLPGLHKINDKK